jgi:hypothetical protein
MNSVVLRSERMLRAILALPLVINLFGEISPLRQICVENFGVS